MATITAGDFRNGKTFEMDGKIMQVVEFQHVKPGKGAAFVRTKMKNIVTGAVTETSFNPTAKFEEAFVERKDMAYSYNDGDLYYFMDQETFDMIPLGKDLLGDAFRFITENTVCKVLSYKGNVFGLECPNFMELEVTETEFEITAEGEGFRYVLSKQTGFFESIVKGGEELLTKPMKLSYFRATTDNDRNVKALWDRTNIWQGENFDCVFNKVYSAKIQGNRASFNMSSAGISRLPFFKYTLNYEFFADGSVKTELCGDIRENVIWLPRLGFELALPLTDGKFKYFGNGPLESYRDMTHHGVIGVHSSDAGSEYVNYVRPQEHGNHTDCKWLEISDKLRFEAENKMEICVLSHSIEQLTAAEHTDEIAEPDATHIRIDYKVSGIGSASCGPELDKKYRLDEKHISFTFKMSLI